MIVSNIYPYLDVRFDVRGQICRAMTYIDTGFYSEYGRVSLLVPQTYKKEFGKPDFYGRAVLADGRKVRFAYYRGSVKVNGIIRLAMIICGGDEFLIGRELIDEFKVTFEKAQRVIIDTENYTQ